MKHNKPYHNYDATPQTPPAGLSPRGDELSGAPQPEQAQLEHFLKAAIAGEVEAFGELYRLYAEAIFSYCAFRVSNLADAEDLTAQVFLKAFQAIADYRITQVPFGVWLYRIAHNLVINFYKRRQHKVEVADAGLDEHFLETICDDSKLQNNPFEHVLHHSQQQLLYQALARLSEEHQQVLYLRFIEEWSHAEIATFLSKKEGTVRGIQYRALMTLSKLLAREDLVGS